MELNDLERQLGNLTLMTEEETPRTLTTMHHSSSESLELRSRSSIRKSKPKTTHRELLKARKARAEDYLARVLSKDVRPPSNPALQPSPFVLRSVNARSNTLRLVATDPASPPPAIHVALLIGPNEQLNKDVCKMLVTDFSFRLIDVKSYLYQISQMEFQEQLRRLTPMDPRALTRKLASGHPVRMMDGDYLTRALLRKVDEGVKDGDRLFLVNGLSENPSAAKRFGDTIALPRAILWLSDATFGGEVDETEIARHYGVLVQMTPADASGATGTYLALLAEMGRAMTRPATTPVVASAIQAVSLDGGEDDPDECDTDPEGAGYCSTDLDDKEVERSPLVAVDIPKFTGDLTDYEPCI